MIAPDVHALLSQAAEGDSDAFQEAFVLIRQDLHRIARWLLRQKRAGRTLQATAVVIEAFLRLRGNFLAFENTAHVKAVVSKAASGCQARAAATFRGRVNRLLAALGDPSRAEIATSIEEIVCPILRPGQQSLLSGRLL